MVQWPKGQQGQGAAGFLDIHGKQALLLSGRALGNVSSVTSADFIGAVKLGEETTFRSFFRLQSGGPGAPTFSSPDLGRLRFKKPFGGLKPRVTLNSVFPRFVPYTHVPTIKLNPFIRSNKILIITNDRRIVTLDCN